MLRPKLLICPATATTGAVTFARKFGVVELDSFATSPSVAAASLARKAAVLAAMFS
jgi:hypothetical protein